MGESARAAGGARGGQRGARDLGSARRPDGLKHELFERAHRGNWFLGPILTIRTWRVGGHALSWLMLALFGTGIGLWLLYGLRMSAPQIFANALTGVQILVIVGLKIWRR